MENLFDVLQQRGFVQQASDPEGLRQRLEQSITLYVGFDPTASSLHAGHLIQIMALAWAQRCGHLPIALVGGGTALIGDPSGRTESRPILTEEQIGENVERFKMQLSSFLDFDEGALLRNNADWLIPLRFVDFMRDIGSRFSVNEMLRLEAYRTRLDAGGLTFLEFSYLLTQSYDFLQLYREENCELQVGGSDQWGNIVSGADLIRRVTGNQAFAVVTPLITTSSGAKMGKTAAGALWLDPEMTSPYDYYQYWRNAADADVRKFLLLLTFLPVDEIDELTRGQGQELNRVKEVLAFQATAIVHGEQEARRAQEAARALFAGGDSAEVPSFEIARGRVQDMPVTDLFREVGLVESANEARNLIRQGGLSIDGQAVDDPRARLDLGALQNGSLMLSRGRKRHLRVILV